MKNIFEEFTFPNGTVIRNRLVLAPMTTYSSNDDLTLSKEEEIYYNSRSKGMGMVVTAATAISKNAQAFANQISIRDERYLDSMKRLSQAIKKEGAKAILQIHHGGRMNVPGMYPNQDIVSASAVKANRKYAVVPRALRTSEVYDIIDHYVNAARLAIKAGFDGIEIHGANTYLIQQFFSPNSNQRTDEFGGSLEKRLVFPTTIVDRILALRDEKKPNFIVGYRFSPEEIETPGITLEDTKVLVDTLAQKDLDYLHISLGSYNQTSLREKENKTPIGLSLSEVITNRVPFIASGSIDSVETSDNALKLGYDLVSLGMIALSDKDIVEKLKTNKLPNKHITKDALLPTPLYNRLKEWKSISSKGYSIE